MGIKRAQFVLNLILARQVTLEWPSHSDASQEIIHINYPKQCVVFPYTSADNSWFFTE